MVYSIGDFGPRSKDGVAMMWSLLFSCAEEVTPLPVECSDTITYETVGQPFLRNYCTSCHSSSLPSGKRYGAPLDVNLDSYNSAKQFALRSYVRAVHFEDMPAGGGVSEPERQRFAQWALCGAQGSEVYTPTVEPESRVSSTIVFSNVVVGNSDAELVLERYLDDDRFSTPQQQLLREEYYRKGSDGLLFEGYQEWSPEGDLISSVSWEPALVIVDAEFSSTQTVTATIELNGASWTEEQEWTGLQEWQALWEIDIHERESNPLHTQLWNQQGETWGWRSSSVVVLSSAYGTTISDRTWASQQFSGPDFVDVTDPFPLNVDMGWIDLWMEEL